MSLGDVGRHPGTQRLEQEGEKKQKETGENNLSRRRLLVGFWQVQGSHQKKMVGIKFAGYQQLSDRDHITRFSRAELDSL